ncbi:MAG: hypothetical protein LBG99_09130 [Propionibacteriaceae bacterium]|nr:hypothetical protein [Propionibacteriaceae bacterium]
MLTKESGRTQRGWVTAEMAFAALGLGLAIVLCIGGLSIGLAQIRCNDAAGEIARQAARDDLTAVREIKERLPGTATVNMWREGNRVVVHVSILMRPWGTYLPSFTVQSKASVAAEGTGR